MSPEEAVKQSMQNDYNILNPWLTDLHSHDNSDDL